MNKKVLVVIDMQNDFITGVLGNPDRIRVVDEVVKLIENGNYDEIYVTRDAHKENYLETYEGKHLPIKHCIKDTEGYEIVDKVQNALKKVHSRKKMIKYYDKVAFGSIKMTNDILRHLILDSAKQNSNINIQIDFCGVCTGICVINNALLARATLPEAHIRIIADACACVTYESHEMALQVMKMSHIEIVENSQYWVSFLIQDNKDKTILCPILNSVTSIEEAKSIIEKGKKNYRVLSAWIDKYDNNNNKVNVFHECYVDTIGKINS